jgi:XTP/dITP diphosphohydrolase
VKLVLASNNVKKLAELRALFDGLPIELVGQNTLGIGEAEEPHVTFVENALAKARHAARASGLAAIADDSGLCVDALGGAPGVMSAVYAPAPVQDGDRETRRRAQDAANNALLLERLRGHRDRRCRFVSTLVALEMPRGSGGFGYDPLVWVESLQASVAELDAATKNRVSHRALAAAQMRVLMRDAWRLA